MRQFYLTFPNSYALRSELSWTHYRLLMRVENDNARQFYMDEAVKSQWSTRQLERQINTFFYERLLISCYHKNDLSAEIKKIRTGEKVYCNGCKVFPDSRKSVIHGTGSCYWKTQKRSM